VHEIEAVKRTAWLGSLARQPQMNTISAKKGNITDRKMHTSYPAPAWEAVIVAFTQPTNHTIPWRVLLPSCTPVRLSSVQSIQNFIFVLIKKRAVLLLGGTAFLCAAARLGPGDPCEVCLSQSCAPLPRSAYMIPASGQISYTACDPDTLSNSCTMLIIDLEDLSEGVL
jgi:hypothetical protein